MGYELAIDDPFPSLYTQDMEKSSRFWDAPTAALLLLLIQIPALRLVITDWTIYLYFSQTLAFFGAVIGLALGVSRFQSRSAFWLGAAYSLAVIPLQLIGAVEIEAPLLEKLGIVIGRLFFSLDQFIVQKPVDDPLFFVALISVAFWMLALTSGYWLTRQGNVLAALTLAGLATLIIQAYDSFFPSRLWLMAGFSFIALLMLGRIHFVREKEGWNLRRVFLSPDSAQDINRQFLLLAVIAVFITWTIPVSISEWNSAAAKWNRFIRPFRERFSNAVSALESPYGSKESANFYGDQLSLGRVAAQGTAPILFVTVEGVLREEPPRYYWRGRVYDHYANGKWTSESTSVSNFNAADDRLDLADTDTRREVSFTVTMRLKEQTLLYVPSEPFWVSRSGSVEAVRLPDQSMDVTAWLADPALTTGSSYQVRALIANPSIEDLRAAGQDYPAWVSGQYLQVPQEIAIQIGDLAAQVTDGLDNPYDQATAITAYLRREIEYSTALTELPRDRDPLLWVLFDYKKGFCMYYASAEVMMLRSLGIPARLAVGFAEGQYDEAEQTYTVIRTDAHAWPEVYFPGIGWVEFEPTANQAPLARPVEEETRPNQPVGTPIPELGDNLPPAGLEELNTPPSTDSNPDRAINRLLLNILYGALIIGMFTAGIFLTRRYSLAERLPVYLAGRYAKNGNQPPRWLTRWARWANLTSIERSFEAVNWSLRTLGHPQAMHVTPAERAARLRDLLPTVSSFIDILAEEHQTNLFTSRYGNSARARRAALRVVLETWRVRILGIPLEDDLP